MSSVILNSKWGFIDTKGNIVIEPKFDMARSFEKGRANVNLGEEWFCIDTKGNKIEE